MQYLVCMAGSVTTLTPTPQPSVHPIEPDTSLQNPCIHYPVTCPMAYSPHTE